MHGFAKWKNGTEIMALAFGCDRRISKMEEDFMKVNQNGVICHAWVARRRTIGAYFGVSQD